MRKISNKEHEVDEDVQWSQKRMSEIRREDCRGQREVKKRKKQVWR